MLYSYKICLFISLSSLVNTISMQKHVKISLSERQCSKYES